MIAIGHTAVGVVIGVVASELLPASIPLPLQIAVVGVIGLASHYVMDILPHGHYDFNQKQLTPRQKLFFSLDFILPICVVLLYVVSTTGINRLSWLVCAGILGAQTPDLLMGLRSKQLLPQWNWLNYEARQHSRTHWHNPTDPAKSTNEGGRKLGYSDIWQVAVLVLALYMLFGQLR